MNENIKCFNNKDFGALTIRILSYCLLICGVLLIVQQDISHSLLVLGIKIIAIISGVSLIFHFVLNGRSRFRPGWTLQVAIILSLLGGLYLILPLFPYVEMPNIGLTSIIICLSAINGVLLVSSGIQLKSLLLGRWIMEIILGVMNGAYAILVYINVANLRQEPILASAVFMIIFAIQCFLEGIYSLWKI